MKTILILLVIVILGQIANQNGMSLTLAYGTGLIAGLVCMALVYYKNPNA